MDKAPIYIHIGDEDYFRIMQLSWVGDSLTPVDSYPSNLEIYRRWQRLSSSVIRCPYQTRCFNFFTVYLVISAGEKEQRVFHRRITDKNTRNITYHVELARKYLKESIASAIRQEVYLDNKDTRLPSKEIDKRVKEKLTMLFPQAKKFDELIEKAVRSAKEDWGFPAVDPVDCSYKVTDAVVTTATTVTCKEYLESLQTREAIFPQELTRIEQELRRRFSANNEADQVMEILKATKSREHIAAFSITTEKDQTCLSIVNMHRQYIRMESWKFLALIERSGESLRLAELYKPKMGEPPPVFVFNANREGEIVGKFDIHKSIIEVVCLESSTTPPRDLATFVVDSTYTLCIYTALKRLKEDSERFKRLREAAQTLVSVRDPFDYIYQPLNT